REHEAVLLVLRVEVEALGEQAVGIRQQIQVDVGRAQQRVDALLQPLAAVRLLDRLGLGLLVAPLDHRTPTSSDGSQSRCSAAMRSGASQASGESIAETPGPL